MIIYVNVSCAKLKIQPWIALWKYDAIFVVIVYGGSRAGCSEIAGSAVIITFSGHITWNKAVLDAVNITHNIVSISVSDILVDLQKVAVCTVVK